MNYQPFKDKILNARYDKHNFLCQEAKFFPYIILYEIVLNTQQLKMHQENNKNIAIPYKQRALN